MLKFKKEKERPGHFEVFLTAWNLFLGCVFRIDVPEEKTQWGVEYNHKKGKRTHDKKRQAGDALFRKYQREQEKEGIHLSSTGTVLPDPDSFEPYVRKDEREEQKKVEEPKKEAKKVEQPETKPEPKPKAAKQAKAPKKQEKAEDKPKSKVTVRKRKGKEERVAAPTTKPEAKKAETKAQPEKKETKPTKASKKAETKAPKTPEKEPDTQEVQPVDLKSFSEGVKVRTVDLTLKEGEFDMVEVTEETTDEQTEALLQIIMTGKEKKPEEVEVPECIPEPLRASYKGMNETERAALLHHFESGKVKVQIVETKEPDLEGWGDVTEPQEDRSLEGWSGVILEGAEKEPSEASSEEKQPETQANDSEELQSDISISTSEFLVLALSSGGASLDTLSDAWDFINTGNPEKQGKRSLFRRYITAAKRGDFGPKHIKGKKFSIVQEEDEFQLRVDFEGLQNWIESLEEKEEIVSDAIEYAANF